MYKFKNKNLLLEALTHESYQTFVLQRDEESAELFPSYEKLEVLGDAVLDTIVNSNLIGYTFKS